MKAWGKRQLAGRIVSLSGLYCISYLADHWQNKTMIFREASMKYSFFVLQQRPTEHFVPIRIIIIIASRQHCNYALLTLTSVNGNMKKKHNLGVVFLQQSQSCVTLCTYFSSVHVRFATFPHKQNKSVYRGKLKSQSPSVFLSVKSNISKPAFCKAQSLQQRTKQKINILILSWAAGENNKPTVEILLPTYMWLPIISYKSTNILQPEENSIHSNDVIFSAMEGRSGSPTTHQTAEMLRSASTRLVRLAVHACCCCGQWIFAMKDVPAWCSAAKSGCVAGNSHHDCIFLYTTTTNLKKHTN